MHPRPETGRPKKGCYDKLALVMFAEGLRGNVEMHCLGICWKLYCYVGWDLCWIETHVMVTLSRSKNDLFVRIKKECEWSEHINQWHCKWYWQSKWVIIISTAYDGAEMMLYTVTTIDIIYIYISRGWAHSILQAWYTGCMITCFCLQHFRSLTVLMNFS